MQFVHDENDASRKTHASSKIPPSSAKTPATPRTPRDFVTSRVSVVVDQLLGPKDLIRQVETEGLDTLVGATKVRLHATG